jgi:hypothetical protein
LSKESQIEQSFVTLLPAQSRIVKNEALFMIVIQQKEIFFKFFKANGYVKDDRI